MSGGFFRGTTADQDTRFSNKQAKLMKSQKFAPELENLVDMTKVKMDVMRPWIAHRVTELLGFEDEVLINFIYGLLEEKVVNGKEIQITLTGFMEKNTGKFMKELWTHLISAQKNVSGVPQEFLDAKVEEARKKKVETDRITSEIQQKKEKEGRELDQERMKKMDGDDGVSRAKNAATEPSSRHESKDSTRDEKDFRERNRSRGRSRVSRSPHVADDSPAQPRRRPSRSISKSPNPRSLSNGRDRSRSISVSSQPGRRSVSSGEIRRSPSRRSATPRQSLSPSRRGSSQLRRRSLSRSRLRSPSPVKRRMRSPVQRRSRSPMLRRSRSPMRRKPRSPMPRRSRSPVRRRSRSHVRRRSRSPIRRRSRSPLRRRSRSPIWRRSRSPVRYRARSPVPRRSRSPLKRRSQLPRRLVAPSPGHRRSLSPSLRSSLSPGPGRSPSPVRRLSPSPVRRGSPSLVRSPVRGRSPPPVIRRYRRAPSTPRRRSPSPTRRRPSNAGRQGSPSPRRRSLSPQERTSLSPIHRGPGRRSPKHQRRSPLRSSRYNLRTIEKYSPVRRAPPREKVEHTVESGKGSGSSECCPVSERSPQRDFRDRNGLHNKAPALSPSPFKSPSYSHTSPAARRSTVADRRLSSPESPAEQMRDAAILVGGSSPLKRGKDKPIRESLASVEHEEVHFAREEGKKSKVSAKIKVHSAMTNEHTNSVEKARYKNYPSPERLTERRSGEVRSRTDNAELKTKNQKLKSENIAERVSYPEYIGKELPHTYKSTLSNERSRSHQNNAKAHDRLDDIENVSKLPRKSDGNGHSGSVDSGSEESGDQRVEVKGRRKHKRSRKKDVASDDDDSHDSHAEERKEAKRRRKEEKRLEKEERRRRRAERRRRRDDRHTEKQKGESGGNISPPSDFGNSHDGSASDGEHSSRKKSRTIDSEAAVSEQKRLEIELREKALESLRAKMGVGH